MSFIYGFRPLTGIMIFNFKINVIIISINRFSSFRPLTGIMIFNSKIALHHDWYNRFRPLTGIMIFNSAGNCGDNEKVRKRVSVPLRGL